jgi:hypothetical protein
MNGRSSVLAADISLSQSFVNFSTRRRPSAHKTGAERLPVDRNCGADMKSTDAGKI